MGYLVLHVLLNGFNEKMFKDPRENMLQSKTVQNVFKFSSLKTLPQTSSVWVIKIVQLIKLFKLFPSERNVAIDCTACHNSLYGNPNCTAF